MKKLHIINITKLNDRKEYFMQLYSAYNVMLANMQLFEKY